MNSRSLIAKNAFALLASQIITNALSFATVPLIARMLGTENYGLYWFGTSVAAVVGLVAEFGQDGYVVLAVARARDRAPQLLATGALLRITIGIAVCPALEVALRLLGYDATTREVVFLLYAALLLTNVTAGAMAVLRGLERMGWAAVGRVITEVLHTALLLTALALGAQVVGIAWMEVVTAILGLFVGARALAKSKLSPTSPSLAGAFEILRGGAPFFLWGGILALQPGLEALLLSKLSSPAAMGWYGGGVKLTTLLLFPATILGGAFAPTLARLHSTEEAAFQRGARQALRAALLLGAPVAIGAFFFADQGVRVVYGEGFGPAADIVRVLSMYVLPVFVDIVLGTVLLASGRQLAWALSKGAMVAIGAAASLVLIPYWQARSGNGGMGAAMATAGGEIGMLFAAFAFLPRGLLDRSSIAAFLRAVAAAAAMAVVAHFLAGRILFVIGVPCALLAYAATLVLTGGVGLRELALVREMLRRGMVGTGSPPSP